MAQRCRALTLLCLLAQFNALHSLCAGYPAELRAIPAHDLSFFIHGENALPPFYSLPLPAALPSPPRVQSVLRCAAETNEPLCDVRLTALHAHEGVRPLALELHLSSDTSTPALSSPEALAAVLRIEGGDWHGLGTASWLSPSVLLLTSLPLLVQPQHPGERSPTTSAQLVVQLHVPPLPPASSAACTLPALNAHPVVPFFSMQDPARARSPGSARQCAQRLTLPREPTALRLRQCSYASPLRAFENSTSPSDLEDALAAWRAHTACFSDASRAACACAGPEAPSVDVPVLACEGGLPLSVQSDAAEGPDAPLALTHAPAEPAPPLPLPSWALTGGVAAIGAKGLRLPSRNLPPPNSSWSLSFWVWVWQGPLEGSARGRVRALLFKGPGGASQHRTPSAWLAEDSTRLLLRVSTNGSMDEGGHSAGMAGIPVRQWTHVAFVFQRGPRAEKDEEEGGGSGEAAHDPLTPFTYTLYVNGQLDTAFTLLPMVTVLENEGPLWLGKDAGQFLGVRGLVARLAIHSLPLSAVQVAQAFAETRSVFLLPEEGVPAAPLLPHAPLPLLPPSEALLLAGVVSATRLAEAWGPWEAQEPHSETLHSTQRSAFIASQTRAAWKERRGGALAPCIHAALRHAEPGAGLQCSSPALVQAWQWTLHYLGVGMDSQGAYTRASATGEGAAASAQHFLPRWLPPTASNGSSSSSSSSGYAFAPSSTTQRAMELLSPGGNCSIPFKALVNAYTHIRHAAAGGGGPRSVQDTGAATANARAALVPRGAAQGGLEVGKQCQCQRRG